MTIRVSSSLVSILNGASSSRAAWSSALVSALGASRRVVCKRHANAATPEGDVFTSGTTFRDAAMTGGMTQAGGVIDNFGVTSDLTIATAADLSTGISVLRITGNGHWIEGTIGLPGSGCDFTIPVNPTATNSFALAGTVRINPPPFLPSGVGPAAPALTGAPAKYRIEDWTNPNAPVIAGTILLNVRDADLVATDTEIAESMGDVRVTKSDSTIVLGNFEFGVMMFSMNAACNSEANVPLHQVLGNCRPHGTVWADKYPSLTGYDALNDVTFPPPFKAYLLDAADNVLHTFEMRDGLPINSPLLPQQRTTTDALRPHFTCAELLNWESHEPKLNAKARKFFNGVLPDVLRPTTCRYSDCSNAWIPQGSDSQFNGALHFYALPQWPFPIGAYNSVDYPNAVDPWLYNADTATSASIQQHNRTSGWDYEIGSISGHDRYTGPGGMRPERCVAPPALTAYLTDINAVRPKGNVPYKAMMKAWNRAYMNQSRHFFKDVKSFAGVPQQEIFTQAWSHCKSYYAGSSSGYAPLVDNHIPLFARVTGSSTVPVDKNGRRPWNGDAVDYMHAYSQAGWAVLVNNSPMHMVSHQHYVYSTILSWFGGGRPANMDYTGRFHSRQDAWNWLATTMAWKLASDHPTIGISRSTVDDRAQYMLDGLYNSVYVPSLSSNTVYFQAIRNFGTPAEDFKDSSDIPSTLHVVRTKNSSMAYYMAHVFALMKQTGLWDYLWNKSTQNQEAMTFWVQCYDKYSLDFALDTDIRSDYYMELTLRVPKADPLPALPANWAEWATAVKPKTGVEDWITNPDGTARTERDGNTHLRAQWAFMRRDFDLNVPNPRIVAACAKYQGWYDTYATRVSGGATDWLFRWPGTGIIAPPPVEV